MKSKSISGTALATAAAVLVLSAAAPVAPTLAATIKCPGANACKGQGACKGRNNDCKGKNNCKGLGFLMEEASLCKAPTYNPVHKLGVKPSSPCPEYTALVNGACLPTPGYRSIDKP
jgi:hypothetical protein